MEKKAVVREEDWKSRMPRPTCNLVCAKKVHYTDYLQGPRLAGHGTTASLSVFPSCSGLFFPWKVHPLYELSQPLSPSICPWAISHSGTQGPRSPFMVPTGLPYLPATLVVPRLELVSVLRGTGSFQTMLVSEKGRQSQGKPRSLEGIS